MKNLILMLAMMISGQAFADDSWVVLTKEQKAIVKSDVCAKAALDAAISLVSEEIMDAGVDFPDELRLLDLQVSQRGRLYTITFEDDSSIIVKTKKMGSQCKALHAERMIEFNH